MQAAHMAAWFEHSPGQLSDVCTPGAEAPAGPEWSSFRGICFVDTECAASATDDTNVWLRDS